MAGDDMEYEKTHDKAIKAVSNARNAKQLNKAVIQLMSIAEYFPRSAYELFILFKNTYADLEKACFYLQLAANGGLDKAIIKLGEYYYKGIYFKKDEPLAIQILEPYAGNIPFAANALGCMYLGGTQTKHDLQKAIGYFSKASAMGYGDASYNIGYICLGNHGVPKNEKQALDWFATAASQGYSQACYVAAVLHAENGNDNDCYNWLLKGADLGHTKCIELLPQIHELLFGKRVEYKDMLRQSTRNNCDYSYTSQKAFVQKLEANEAEREHQRTKAHDSLIATAANAGGGYIDYNTGFVFDKDGNEYFADETGFVYSNKGMQYFDDDAKILYSNNDTTFFDKDMLTMFNSQKSSVVFKSGNIVL